MKKTPVIMLVSLFVAVLQSEAAYKKTKLLWKSEFTQEDVARYGMLDDVKKMKGGSAELRPGEGESGGAALYFRGPSHVVFSPKTKLDGLLMLEARVRGIDIERMPGARIYHGPKIMMPHTGFDKHGKPKQMWSGTPVTFGSFAWATWVKIANVPAETDDLTFFLGLQMTTGEFWVDSLRVWRVEKVPDEDVEAPFNAEAAKIPRGRFAGSHNPKALRGVNFFLSRTKPGAGSEDVDPTGEFDMAKLESWGANLVRVGVHPRGWKTEEEYFERLKPCVDYAARMIDAAVRHGIKVALVLGSCPGCKNTKENSIAITKDFRSETLVKVWTEMATRFSGNETLYGYDILNEPGMPSEDWDRVFEDAVAAIRKVDAKTPVITEKWSRYWPQEMGVIYSVHPYQPHSITHYGVLGSSAVEWSYPGYIDGIFWDKEQMRLSRKDLIEFCEKHPDARILIGEFSCVLWAKGAANWIADAIDFYEEYGWDWCYHSYGGGWGGWNVEYAPDANLTPKKYTKAKEDTDRKKVLLKGLSYNVR